MNLDFDGLASMVAAKKLYPQAKLILPSKQGKTVERFLAIYRDSLNLYHPNEINWQEVRTVIMVDIASLQRTGDVAKYINDEEVEFIVYDHHEENDHNVQAKLAKIEKVGATVTLILEKIKTKNISITSFEATIFALGLYTDTGSFTYLTTTPRDLKMASFLIENGANLQVISKFTESPLQEEEQQLLQCFIQQSEEHFIDGVDILIASHQQNEYIGGLAFLSRKALEMTGTDALIFVVEMGKRIFIVGRSTSERIDILPLVKKLGGGGHKKAASAMVKDGNFHEVLSTVRDDIYQVVKPAITAKDIMTSPVKVVSTKTSIEDAGKMMLRYGHTGFPVLENEKLVGIISRRDVDKAKHHGLGHAPVKGYMSTNPITIDAAMSLEEVQHLMIDENVGRLPVKDNEEIIGIISRTNVIEALHGEQLNTAGKVHLDRPLEITLIDRMNNFLSIENIQLLKQIGKLADQINYSAYIIGGIVRDLIIGRTNEDIDIVVEGNGIDFANLLAENLGGTVRCHEKFGTATWKHPSRLKIDITSARTEYYDYPAALPNVEMSSLKEDLFRRDFTINAMAIHINEDHFGKLIDYFHGYNDIKQNKIKVLYNLSFVEDPTRILRAVRFEQRFNFKMDQQTFDLAMISADKIASTSKPRVAHELNILLKEKHPVESLVRLGEIGIIRYLIGTHSFNVQKLKTFKSLVDEIVPLQQNQNSETWVCYLVILFSETENEIELVKDYCLNNESLKVTDQIVELLDDNQNFLKEDTLGAIHHSLKNYQTESIICYIALMQLQECFAKKLIKYLQNRKQIPKLIDGNDLLNLNVEKGPLFAKILLEIECAYLNQEIHSKEDAISKVKREYL